jgi:predicted permease
MTPPPLLCRWLLATAANLVPVRKRADWRREWNAELACTARRGLLRRTLPCFADALAIRRLERQQGEPVRPSVAGRRSPLLVWDPLSSARRAARSLRQSPVFSVAAVLTLGLGIGANTAIFSFVNAVALKPSAVADPGSLVRIYTSTPEGQPYGSTSFLELQDISEQTQVFDGVVGYTLAVGALTDEGRIELLLGEMVTGNYFDVLGARIAMGRGFRPEEYETPGTHPVIVLGHGLWVRRFGQDPSIVGQTIRLNGTSFDIIGVADESYRGMLPALWVDFWAPAMMAKALAPDVPNALTSRQSRQFMVHARLREGASADEAQAAVSLVAARLAEAFPESNGGHSMTALRADSVRVHPKVDAWLVPMAMAALVVPGLVLLIACTNLAGLMLARATDRGKEIAVRLALGASRRQIVLYLLGESILLSLAGGALGVLLATGLVGMIATMTPPVIISLSLDVGVDYRVLAFTGALSVLVGILFGLVPALRVSKPELSRALKDEEAVPWRARRLSLRNALIIGQVAVSMLLLLVAGLFIRSLQEALTIDPGFDTESSIVFSMNAAVRHDEANGREYYRQVLRRLNAHPGVKGAALADRLPLGFSAQTMQVLVDQPRSGPSRADAREGEAIYFARITPGYFRALGIDLLAGRDFGDLDRQGSPRVTIVSEAAARHLWGDEDPVGKTVRQPGGASLQVVGVARDTRVRTLGDGSEPYLYVPFEQSYESVVELIVATDRDPAAFIGEAQDVILQVDPEVIPLEVMTMSGGNSLILFPLRMAAGLLGGFGALGLLLSSVGLVGSLAYSVSRRSHEVGVRMALGASPGNVVGMVVGGGMRLVVIGMAVGMALALGVGRLIQGLLVGVSPTDPLAFLAVTVLLAAVSLFASWLPARRAAAADPLVVLRNQ